MKALALHSGGLDSTLAIKIILDQGLEIEAVNFISPFYQRRARNNSAENEAKKTADNLGVNLKTINLGKECLDIIRNPKHGYGKNLNPCIDCRILMNRRAKEYMQESGTSFIITGEVVGQRPMSQHKNALRLIDKESGLKGLVLRPLSARVLPLTIPEERQWVRRDRLLAISGRSRKPQITLARHYHIADYPAPAGGCLLTDPGFSRRLKDLLDHHSFNLEEIELLKIGRHFRLSASAKLVVGRNQQENLLINSLASPGELHFCPARDKGPEALARGKFSALDIKNACRIIARYCDNNNRRRKIKISLARYARWQEKQVIQARPISERALRDLRI